ncbi:hypothetical protein J7376_17820 [Paracoccus sp. R12_1]|uniref:hypothetical protein n=1 Tax=unclassified Paracoccus (in: a-proteobacteria) TaxID=2688777 RepID=UPI001AD9DDD4|nr:MULTISPECIES: hypothetical protein [unclassified Paracoccus (in: a-proteobacteria)]MBO9457125.1 hypothetical protein [Paracoccus sp. R12_2]MBO9488377.1 hypothetical protein [Paracoccus sp. R12_1]
MFFDKEQRVLWLGQVRSVPFRERVELAAQNGYGILSTSPADFVRTVARGIWASGWRMIASDHGVTSVSA